MKVIGIITTAVLSLLLGTAAPAYAQHEEHAQQKEHAQQQHAQASQPAQHEQHAQQAKPAHQQHAQKSKSSAQHEQHAQKSKSSAQHEQHAQKSRPSTSRPARKQQAARRGDHDRGRRIPEEHFRANFGREHRFQINRPIIVDGVPRFQYGGYWFGFYDPWPVGWYYTDDVYVDFIGGGYYLFNPRHPGIRLAIRVF
jgi:Tfp pilus assembly protein PilE